MRNFRFDWAQLRAFTPAIETSLDELSETVTRFLKDARELSDSAKTAKLSEFIADKNISSRETKEAELFRDIAKEIKFYDLGMRLDRFQEKRDLDETDFERVEAGKGFLKACIEINTLLGIANKTLTQFDDYLWENKNSAVTKQVRQQGNHLKMSASHLHDQTALMQARLIHSVRKTDPSAPSLHIH